MKPKLKNSMRPGAMGSAAIQAYLQQAQAIIGERSPEEKAYDDEVLAGLKRGLPIMEAIKAASQRFPSEALQVGDAELPDVKSHYDYLAQHQEILRRLGMPETF